MTSLFVILHEPKLKSKYNLTQRPTLVIIFGKEKSGNTNPTKITMADVVGISFM